METLKFKAYNTATNKMMLWKDIQRFRNLVKLIFLNHVKVLQFSGFTDKNRSDVYKGDILKLKYEDECEPEGYGISYSEVVFDKGAYCLRPTFSEKSEPFFMHYPKGVITDMEIVGNIYQTPELLVMDLEVNHDEF